MTRINQFAVLNLVVGGAVVSADTGGCAENSWKPDPGTMAVYTRTANNTQIVRRGAIGESRVEIIAPRQQPFEHTSVRSFIAPNGLASDVVFTAILLCTDGKSDMTLRCDFFLNLILNLILC